MAVAAHFYDNYWISLNAAKINLLADSIKLMLLTSAYVPNRGTNIYRGDIVANELAAGGGYSTGGVIISSMGIAAAGNIVTITGANASWPAATFAAAFAALYDGTPATDATRPLIGYVDFGGVQSPSNGTLSVTWNASGIGTVTDS
jgi:hypothetical protein